MKGAPYFLPLGEAVDSRDRIQKLEVENGKMKKELAELRAEMEELKVLLKP